MKRLIYTALIAATGIFGSCINNDIPTAKIEADITAFQVEGQVGNAVISRTNRTITVELNETVNIANVAVTEFAVEAEDGITEVKTQLKTGDKISLLSPYTVTLTTYQDYEWTITATQTISRSVTVENQVGSAVFDPAEKTVKVYVDMSHPLNNIKVTGMKLGQDGSTIDPDFTTVHDFTSPVEFTVKYEGRSEKWKVSVLHVDGAITGESDPWAKFANLYGIYSGSDSEVTFEYRVKGASSWSTAPAGSVTASGGDASCKLPGLTPVTTYEYRLALGEVKGETSEFTTETADQLLGMSFDEWHSVKSGSKDVWYANKDNTGTNYIWDSGNRGAILGGNSITTPEESHLAVAGDGKRAAKLASSTALGIFAAGNIFAGRFIKAVVFPNMGGELTMGVPYSSRPLRLKGYYDYSPGTIDKTKSPYTDLNGTIDRCHIYVVLAERNDPFEISTADKKFIDFENDPSIIAFGELVSDVKTNGYREFSIDLTYRDDRKPTMVAIVASASRYGDYFTGSTKSVLYIDEFEFDFEAN